MVAALRGILSFWMPGGLLFVTAVILIQQQSLAQWLPALGEFYPYTVFAVAMLLGWRFDRSRLVFAALILALADRLLVVYGTRPDYIGHIVVDAATVLLPLNLALLAIFKERGVLTWRGLQRLTLIMVQPLLVALLIYYERFDLLGVFDAVLVHSPALQGLPLSQSAMLSFILALLVVGFTSLWRRNALEIGFFWALLAAFLGVLTTGAASTIYLATSLLILVVAVVEISYGMAFRDELTGLNGRRALNQTMLKLGNRYAIAMLDIDHFKKFNDTYGHDIGDQVLKMVAARVAEVTGGGKSYRYGGEEFTVVFPGKHVEDVLEHLDQLRRSVESSEFVIRHWKRPRQKPQEPRNGGNKRVQVTISIGVAERDDRYRSPEAVIKAADQALYRAKEAGRNKVSA